MLQISLNDHTSFSVKQEDGKWYLNDQAADWDARFLQNGLICILYNGKSFTAIIENVDRAKKEMSLRVNGQVYNMNIKEPIDLLLSSMGMDMKAGKKLEPIKAPMPGMVLKVLVQPGQAIHKGDGLLILEAMKMENVLKAGHDATVKAIKVSERTAVEKGAVLIELE
jgi:biotin carboxyl carrier protein